MSQYKTDNKQGDRVKSSIVIKKDLFDWNANTEMYTYTMMTVPAYQRPVNQ
jgi:hypothetical protein